MAYHNMPDGFCVPGQDSHCCPSKTGVSQKPCGVRLCCWMVETPQGMKERPVSVLASADSAGVVVLSICGVYRLITIDLRVHRKPTKGKGRASGGVDSPRQRRSRRSPGQDGAGFSGLTESEVDIDGTGPALRPLQLTVSADLSVLTALVEFDGQVELIQVTKLSGTYRTLARLQQHTWYLLVNRRASCATAQ